MTYLRHLLGFPRLKCRAKTRAGKRCSKRRLLRSEFCRVHQGHKAVYGWRD